ncbi:hypothetical protein DSUL_50310 [Desulfovibrionales bacterium]
MYDLLADLFSLAIILIGPGNGYWEWTILVAIFLSLYNSFGRELSNEFSHLVRGRHCARLWCN